ncbi:magnesium/cobalt transporter CorA [Polyangium aurulentum]|uniref:magnesium/cobalt transporter CorA n=1 Tax=Polyangium aurulentum TaxID=2567896 RepID=UPI001F466B45|nr:magnesium/cobalt transporter CorA [Polyangium aurulentum]
MEQVEQRHTTPPPSSPPSERRRGRTNLILPNEPAPGASPGTLVLEDDEKPKIYLMDYCTEHMIEKQIGSVDECIEYLTDDTPSVTWIDVQGIGHKATFERLGEIFKIHPLALEDVVNVPQRPKSDVYAEQQLVICRMAQCSTDGQLVTEQLSILFGKGFVLTIQEEPNVDVLEPVRERIRRGRGSIRKSGADYLAYALFDAIIDGFYPVLEKLGERLEDLELEVLDGKQNSARKLHDIKRELLAMRRAIWPQRELANALLRDDSPHIQQNTRLYLRDTYDHAVQVMDMVETFREIASGLMDLYLSGMSTRMNEIMKVLTIISTIFLPLTFIAGVYGMNFDTNASPANMPELKWRYGYEFALGLMALSVIGLLFYYRKKGWLGRRDD